ncbi:hypothetical protein GCM10010472_53470 [Pseudonocardia halophobica]|uniref:Uncharacterized protein n=1 Tax=Pseudonocardia halophobica TaxID=29401 RepID=A0A9W6L1K0_9PSEU|nr:hypothetical protein GCM10017577_31730 [Pseudonocardia halophobica]
MLGVASPPRARAWAFEAVLAVLSDDVNAEQGTERARAVAAAVLAEAGEPGLTETVVVLSSTLAEALERIAAERGLVAADLAEIWFVD